jgi:hypothetical protein
MAGLRGVHSTWIRNKKSSSVYNAVARMMKRRRRKRRRKLAKRVAHPQRAVVWCSGRIPQVCGGKIPQHFGCMKMILLKGS